MADAPIGGQAYTVNQLFANHRFRLDYYQREYTWSRDDVRTLLNDLYRRFAANWNPSHSRYKTATYSPYFLGPFVYFEDGGVTYLVDGQQRLTTLHLLLLYMRRMLQDLGEEDDAVEMDRLTSKNEFGKQTFTIDIDERAALLASIRANKRFELPSVPMPSVQNLYARSRDLEEDFPTELRDERLVYFVDWLRNRVCLVGIKALGRDSGWEIFETMNDRGSRLDPIDLLKSFLLSRADVRHAELNAKWREMLSRLSALGSRVPSDFIKTLLLARYADPFGDDDQRDIERAFHEWVREHHERIGLTSALDFQEFVEGAISPLADRYATLIRSSERPQSGLETVFYNAANGLGYQYVLILATLQPTDSRVVFMEKAQMVAAFVDLLYVRRHINGNASQPARLDAELLTLLPQVRACSNIESLRQLLGLEIVRIEDGFGALATFGLRPDNRSQVRYLLARMTAFVEAGVGGRDAIEEYLDKDRPFEVEHIWADKFERYQAQTRTVDAFRSQRNRLGALLLLHKSDNASYRDDTYAKKIEYYRRQNMLAASLHPRTYEKNPRFSRFRKESGLEKHFRAFPVDLDSAAIKHRQDLYMRLCELIWDPARLGFTVPKKVSPVLQRARRSRARYEVTLEQLIGAGMLNVGDVLTGVSRGVRYNATLENGGKLRVESGELFGSPSAAGMFVLDRGSLNGWTFWKIDRGGKIFQLKDLRDEALRDGILERLVSGAEQIAE
jgi:hypothetical protein